MRFIVWKSLSHLIHLHRILGVLLLLFLVYDAQVTYSKWYFTLCDTCYTLTLLKVGFFIFRGEGIQREYRIVVRHAWFLNGVHNAGIKRLTSHLFYSWEVNICTIFIHLLRGECLYYFHPSTETWLFRLLLCTYWIVNFHPVSVPPVYVLVPEHDCPTCLFSCTEMWTSIPVFCFCYLFWISLLTCVCPTHLHLSTETPTFVPFLSTYCGIQSSHLLTFTETLLLLLSIFWNVIVPPLYIHWNSHSSPLVFVYLLKCNCAICLYLLSWDLKNNN